MRLDRFFKTKHWLNPLGLGGLLVLALSCTTPPPIQPPPTPKNDVLSASFSDSGDCITNESCNIVYNLRDADGLKELVFDGVSKSLTGTSASGTFEKVFVNVGNNTINYRVVGVNGTTGADEIKNGAVIVSVNKFLRDVNVNVANPSGVNGGFNANLPVVCDGNSVGLTNANGSLNFKHNDESSSCVIEKSLDGLKALNFNIPASRENVNVNLDLIPKTFSVNYIGSSTIFEDAVVANFLNNISSNSEIPTTCNIKSVNGGVLFNGSIVPVNEYFSNLSVSFNCESILYDASGSVTFNINRLKSITIKPHDVYTTFKLGGCNIENKRVPGALLPADLPPVPVLPFTPSCDNPNKTPQILEPKNVAYDSLLFVSADADGNIIRKIMLAPDSSIKIPSSGLVGLSFYRNNSNVPGGLESVALGLEFPASGFDNVPNNSELALPVVALNQSDLSSQYDGSFNTPLHSALIRRSIIDFISSSPIKTDYDITMYKTNGIYNFDSDINRVIFDNVVRSMQKDYGLTVTSKILDEDYADITIEDGKGYYVPTRYFGDAVSVLRESSKVIASITPLSVSANRDSLSWLKGEPMAHSVPLQEVLTYELDKDVRFADGELFGPNKSVLYSSGYNPGRVGETIHDYNANPTKSDIALLTHNRSMFKNPYDLMILGPPGWVANNMIERSQIPRSYGHGNDILTKTYFAIPGIGVCPTNNDGSPNSTYQDTRKVIKTLEDIRHNVFVRTGLINLLIHSSSNLGIIFTENSEDNVTFDAFTKKNLYNKCPNN